MSEEQIEKKQRFMNFDRMLIVLVVLIVLYAVTKNWSDSSSLSACKAECVELFQANAWALDSFCICQNNALSDANNWFVKEDIRKNGLINFFLKEDTTNIKPLLIKCMKSNLKGSSTAAINYEGSIKEILNQRCIKLLDDKDFRKNNDIEIYCSCYLNKTKDKLTINSLFENDFFNVDNFLPIDSLCLESSYR